MQPVLQTQFIQRVFFPERPPRHLRQALAAAGFRYTGGCWIHSTGTASPVSMAFIEQIAQQYIQNNGDTAIAHQGQRD